MMENKGTDMTQKITTSDSLYELMTRVMNYAHVRLLKEEDPKQYDELLEIMISVASQPNKIYR